MLEITAFIVVTLCSVYDCNSEVHATEFPVRYYGDSQQWCNDMAMWRLHRLEGMYKSSTGDPYRATRATCMFSRSDQESSL
jgi:hypothetical protein